MGSVVQAQIENVFISYETSTGAEFARQAKALCEDAGIEAWMWEIDREPGAYPIEQIATQIDHCTVFFYFCTVLDDSQTSLGQKYERNLALNLNKSVRIFTTDEKLVPLVLKAFTYVKFSVDTFGSRCEEVIGRLSTTPNVREPAKYLAEAQPVDSEG